MAEPTAYEKLDFRSARLAKDLARVNRAHDAVNWHRAAMAHGREAELPGREVDLVARGKRQVAFLRDRLDAFTRHQTVAAEMREVRRSMRDSDRVLDEDLRHTIARVEQQGGWTNADAEALGFQGDEHTSALEAMQGAR